MAFKYMSNPTGSEINYRLCSPQCIHNSNNLNSKIRQVFVES